MEFNIIERCEERKILESLKNNISFEGNLYFNTKDNDYTYRRYKYDTINGVC